MFALIIMAPARAWKQMQGNPKRIRQCCCLTCKRFRRMARSSCLASTASQSSPNPLTLRWLVRSLRLHELSVHIMSGHANMDSKEFSETLSDPRSGTIPLFLSIAYVVNGVSNMLEISEHSLPRHAISEPPFRCLIPQLTTAQVS